MNPVQVSLDAVTRCKGRADQSVDTPVMVRAEQKSPGQAEHREDRAELDSNEQGEVQAEQTEKNLESKFERSKKWKEIDRDKSGNISLRWVLDKGMEYTSKKRSTTRSETPTSLTRKCGTPKQNENENGDGLNTLKQNVNLILKECLTTPIGEENSVTVRNIGILDVLENVRCRQHILLEDKIRK